MCFSAPLRRVKNQIHWRSFWEVLFNTGTILSDPCWSQIGDPSSLPFTKNIAHQLARLVFSWVGNTAEIHRTY